MKIIIYFALLMFTQTFLAQVETAKKPENVIIIDNEIATMEQVQKYGSEGYIKSMNKGVSEEKRDELAKKFGNKIGDKEFIIMISLYSEKEKNENIEKNKSQIKEDETVIKNDEYVLNVNDKAKDFIVNLIDGEKIKLSDLKGKVVLVNFWATWCGPCLMEFYDIPNKILAPFKNENFVFIAISIGETQEKVSSKVQKLRKDGINFNFGYDPERKLWNEYAKNSIPKNFLIDQNGDIKFVSTGNNEENLDNIAAEIRKLLQK